MYYTQEELDTRRAQIECWMGDIATKQHDLYVYSGKENNKRLDKLTLVTALYKTLENYIPVDETTDGEDNCITEAQLDCVFDNIRILTELCFSVKGETVVEDIRPETPNQPGFFNNGGPFEYNNGDFLELNKKYGQ